ncbi:hypothetical protein D5Q54_10935 [Vibrio cholerae]|nr:hypothetical protein [Vibrio cholerae]
MNPNFLILILPFVMQIVNSIKIINYILIFLFLFIVVCVVFFILEVIHNRKDSIISNIIQL